MKKRSINPLILITLFFAVFMAGFYFGRVSHKEPVTVNSTDGTVPRQDSETVTFSKFCINTATDAQLQTIPGIGPVTAKAILDYRSTHGNFSSLNELLEVPGIGEDTLARMIPYLTIQEDTP